METKFPWENEEPSEPAPTPEKLPAPPDFLKAYREPTGELTPEAAPVPPAEIPTFADTFVPPWEEQTQSADTKPESIPPAEEEPTLPAAAPFLDRLRSIAEAPQPSGAAEPATPSEATDKAPLFSDEFKLPWEEEPPAIMPEAAPLTPETTVPEQPTRAPAREEPFAQTASFLDRFKNAPEAPKQTIVEPAPEPVQPVPATTFPPGFVPPWEEVQQEQPVQNAQASQPEAPTTAEPVVMPDETKLPWEEDSTTAESVGTEPVTPEPESTEPVTPSPEAVNAELTAVEPMASEAAPVEQPAAEPTATEQASVSGFPADFKPPWEEDTPAMGENPAETLPYPWEQAAPASSDVTQPMRVAGKPATQTPVEVTQPQAVLEPARTFEPPTLAMQTRPLQSPWMAKTHPLARVSDAEASGITQATYTCVIVPRSPLIHLAGNISDMLSEWVPQLCHSFGWRLDSMVVRFEYMQWTVTIAPSVSASDMIRILREHTSQRIFQNLPRLKPRNSAEEFWANGYLIVNGVEPPASEVLHDYIDQVHKRQSS
jgi:REP element-mobilizing transposase RayT